MAPSLASAPSCSHTACSLTSLAHRMAAWGEDDAQHGPACAFAQKVTVSPWKKSFVFFHSVTVDYRCVVFCTLATGIPPREAPMEQLTYATLYTSSDAKTHFKDEALPWHPVGSSATEPPHVTPLQDATH